MNQRRTKFRPVDGVLVLDKPLGLSSNQALQRVRHLLRVAKGGHTGSLDPEASGVLPLCFGEATKFAQFLLDSDKTYQATVRFGATTDTADAAGQVTSRTSARELQPHAVEAALTTWRGRVEQVPPMVSALKLGGTPLYKLARQGIEIALEPRPVTIHELKLLDFRPGDLAEAELYIHCSKGTYVRSLARDLGESLGVGGHVSALRRLRAGRFDLSGAVSLPWLEAGAASDGQQGEQGSGEPWRNRLLPVECLVTDLECVTLREEDRRRFCLGQAVALSGAYRSDARGVKVRVFVEDGCFLGVGELSGSGLLKPRRLLSSAAQAG